MAGVGSRTRGRRMRYIGVSVVTGALVGGGWGGVFPAHSEVRLATDVIGVSPLSVGLTVVGGVSPFDDAADGPNFDAGPSNGIVRQGDPVTYVIDLGVGDDSLSDVVITLPVPHKATDPPNSDKVPAHAPSGTADQYPASIPDAGTDANGGGQRASPPSWFDALRLVTPSPPPRRQDFGDQILICPSRYRPWSYLQRRNRVRHARPRTKDEQQGSRSVREGQRLFADGDEFVHGM